VPAALTDNALAVLRARYFARENGVVVETPAQLFRRVADHVSAIEVTYGYQPDEIAAGRETFERMMSALEFLPNSPTLMNAGRPLGQLAACFVVPVDDSTTGVFEAVRWAAEIQKTGGGTGFSFSRLRPAGDLVASTGGTASGPVSLMQVFDVATEAIKQGGTRRGANMGMLRVDHPDILEFIAIKLDPSRMRNFNLSVAITDAFMAAVQAGATYDLVNPRTGVISGQLDARRVLDAIANAAWAVGDPGMVFIDRINQLQPTPRLGPIEATNPCVTGDTRIWVEDRGLVPISELVGTTPRVATLDGERVVFREATQVIATGARPIYRLSTVEGVELRLTGDHVVTTDGGDLAAELLEPGDRLRVVSVPARDISRDTADARFGELVGWLTGDGHFTNHGNGKPTAVLSFYGRDKAEAAPRMLDTVRAVIGDDRLGLNRVDARDLAYIRSQRLLAALRESRIDETCKREVPERIWRASAEMVAGYLRGLFSADGSVQGSTSRGASVRLACNELAILRGVQQLLLVLGIRSVIYANRRTETTRLMPDARGELREYACAAQHELCIARSSLRAFASSIGFLIQDKTDKLAAVLDSYRRGPYRDREWLTVGDIELEGEAEVFDLTEPTTSHFFANGLLVHNCGEQPLLPFESCTLGSIDVGKFVSRGDFEWSRLEATIHAAVRFLDNVIDANRYPLAEIERATKATRKIGLGIMGWADALAAMGIPYDSEQALALGDRLATFLEVESLAASRKLAERRGPFPTWKGSRWEEGGGEKPLRNATTTTIAPTGTISIIAGSSSGIEPLYALAYRRNVLDGAELTEVNPAFRKLASDRGFATEEMFAGVAEHGGIRGRTDVPDEVQRWFPTAHEIDVKTHVKMQAVFQRRVHAAVSKTINLHKTATPAEVKGAYELAYELGCKGITVYRDTSREGQVLVTGARSAIVAASPVCPECRSTLVVQSACRLCRHCGWSVCG
jgi:ribonucleoside-diphosphate reductase alpha chain